MKLRTEGELMVAGVRCSACGRWFAVAEGNMLPWCCLAPGIPAGLILEHRPAADLWGQADAGSEVPLLGERP